MVRHLKLEYKPPTKPEGEDVMEPLTFDLRGRQFQCVNAMPAMVALQLGIAQDPEAPEYEKLRAIHSFLTSIVIPEEREGFKSLLVQAVPIIEIDELMGYMNQLGSAIGDRPTEGRQPSAGLPSSTPTISTGDSSTDQAALGESSI